MSTIKTEDLDSSFIMHGVSRFAPVLTVTVVTPWERYLLVVDVSSVEVLSKRNSLLEGHILQSGKGEIVLGSQSAKQFNYRVGNKIFLTNTESFDISGMYYTGNSLLDGAVIMVLEDAQRLLKKSFVWKSKRSQKEVRREEKERSQLWMH